MATKNKKMMLFCEPCGYKRILYPDKPQDDLVEIKTAAVQTKLPVRDPASKKTVKTPDDPQLPKFKCPKCGRGVRVKELLEAYSKVIKEIEDKEEKAKQEEEKKKRLEDGKPLEKKPDPDFTG